MLCSSCGRTAIISSDKSYCEEHFFAHFEATVKDTIERFSLLSKEQKIAVACSGGKDSTILLYLLKEWGYNVEALAIDEGIKGYRDTTLIDLKRICGEFNVPLRIVSYKERFGTTLDAFLQKNKEARACTSCGVWRRHLLNKESRGYDIIATGHNLDDEAQGVMMNLLLGNVRILTRQGPRTGVASDPSFTTRVKPLYFCSEKETATYALLKGFDIKYTECPNAKDSFRAEIRDRLNEQEVARPGTKRNIIEWFLDILPALKEEHLKKAEAVQHCIRCGEPTQREVCASCAQVEMTVK